MEFFRIRKDIPFMKHALVFNAISFITFALAVFFLLTRGLHLSVEFTGGTVMEVAYSQPAELAKVRETVSGLGYADVHLTQKRIENICLIIIKANDYEKISISSSNVYVCLWWFIPCKGSEFCRSCDSPDRNQCNSCQ